MKRSLSSLILETGETEVLISVYLSVMVQVLNPYLAFETFEQILLEGTLPEELTYEKAIKNYLKAIRKGMFKVFAKMGISTIQSYRGAQIFEAIGLSEDVVHEYFAGTPSKISGVTVSLGEECRDVMLQRMSKRQISSIIRWGPIFLAPPREYHQVNPMTTLLLRRQLRKIAENL